MLDISNLDCQGDIPETARRCVARRRAALADLGAGGSERCVGKRPTSGAMGAVRARSNRLLGAPSLIRAGPDGRLGAPSLTRALAPTDVSDGAVRSPKRVTPLTVTQRDAASSKASSAR